MKVAWISRHSPLPIQLSALRERLGEVEIVTISRTFRDAAEVAGELRSTGAKYAVIVLPLSMTAKLLELCRDVTFLYAEMQNVHDSRNCELAEACPEFDPDRDVLLKSPELTRHLRFKRFTRIKEVRMITEPF